MKKILFGLLILGTVSMTGCKKEGCTDPDSVNYDVDAKKSDGSCQFEGESVLWYGQAVSTALVADGATTLTFYVDGQIVGSTATSVYWNGSPTCGDNGSITVTKDLNGVKTQAYSYSVKDQTGFEYWKGTLNFNANTCFETELGL